MRLFKLAAVVAALSCLSACELVDGAGGEGDQFPFAAGYVFIREHDVFIADSADYQNARRLTHSGQASEPAISGDGRVIVYVHTATSGESTLRKINPDGTGDSLLVEATGERFEQPALDASGSRVAFIGASGPSAGGVLYVVNIDGSGLTAIPGSERDASPTFYPNGRDVLVLSAGSGLSFNELVRVELTAGVRASRASGLNGLESRAVLSPDGRKVALEMRSGGATRIFVAEEDGGEPQAVANTGGSERWPTWVDSNRLGFSSDAGGGGIWSVYEVVVGGDPEAYELRIPEAEQCAFGGR